MKRVKTPRSLLGEFDAGGFDGAAGEEALGEEFELFVEVGEEEVEGGGSVLGEEVEGGEVGLQVLGAGGGGVDESNAGAEDRLQGRDEERVVGAGEEEGVHAAVEERLEVGLQGLDGGGVVDPVFFDEGGEEGRGLFKDEEVGSTEGKRVLVGVAADGAASGDDADALTGWFGKGGVDAGLDDADDGDVVVFLEIGEGVGAGGVAGDDDGFDAFGEKEADVLVSEVADGLGALGAVGDSRGIAEVDDGLVREEALHGFDDGEAADAGVKDAERLGVHEMTGALRRGVRQKTGGLENCFLGGFADGACSGTTALFRRFRGS